MAGFKTNDPDAAADELKRQFRAVTRRIEWRARRRGWLAWLGICAAIAAGAAAGYAILP